MKLPTILLSPAIMLEAKLQDAQPLMFSRLCTNCLLPLAQAIPQSEKKLPAIAAKYHVTTVFASHIHLYHHSERLGAPYRRPGAPLYVAPADGRVHHCLLARVNDSRITVERVDL